MKKLLLLLVLAGLFSLVVVSLVRAGGDSMYGTCYASNGEKCIQSNHKISTSWNDVTAFPDSQGKYELEFGGTVDKTITVYCDGDGVGDVHVHGRTKFDVHCR